MIEMVAKKTPYMMKQTIMHGIPGKKYKYYLYGVRKTDNAAHSLAIKAMKDHPKIVAYFITPGHMFGNPMYGVYVR